MAVSHQIPSTKYFMQVPNWKTIVQDRTKWKGVVEKTKTLREL
jgi:hypothetical protein